MKREGKFVEIRVTHNGQTIMIAGDSPFELVESLRESGLDQKTKAKIVERLFSSLHAPEAMQNGVHEELAI